MNFSKTLIYWYLKNKRDLPWRNTRNPYKIWLSEIILQQTRVEQGMSYYFAFLEAFPSVFDLAKSEEQEVLKLWQGLGYYSRARNLHFSAKYIVNERNGEFPNTYKELLKLKGVGDYTASAIASFCFNESTAVVDGNVYRVLSRYFGIDTAINSSKGIKEFKELAQSCIDVENPADHNQAIMEFGARMCKPKNPDCTVCPLNESCFALKEKKISVLPYKEGKVKVKKRYFNFIVPIGSNNKTIIQQREGKGIWQNLYEFPLVETNARIDIDELLKQDIFVKFFDEKSFTISRFNEIEKVHKLSHQHLYTTFWLVKDIGELKQGTSWDAIQEYPFPILIHNFIEELNQIEKISTFDR